MYFYKISEGCYDQYESITLIHEKEYPNIKFAIMYNTIIGEKDSLDLDEIAKQMVDRYGFKIVKPKIEINTDYGWCKKVDLEKFDNDSEYHIINWKD